MEQVLSSVVSLFSPIPCVRAIVLGGSRATGTADDRSDIDIGIYYDAQTLDLAALNEAAKALDSDHRTGLIGPPGSWGNWVNCGGWLTVHGVHVDLILRDIARVSQAICETDLGEISMHYQPGHPHAYLNVMYRGELAVSKTLYAAEGSFAALKARAKAYPDALAYALIGFFLFEAGFSRDHAKKAWENRDLYTLSGHLFRSISALNQALFAFNRTYCLNEKRAVTRADALTHAPKKYRLRTEEIFSNPASARSLYLLDTLIRDTELVISVDNSSTQA